MELTEVKKYDEKSGCGSHYFIDELGRKQGVYKTYYFGALETESNMLDNEYHGEVIWHGIECTNKETFDEYQNTGEIDCKGNYVHGKREGQWLEYGDIIHYSNDKKTGKVTTSNGYTEYKDDLQHGEQVAYFNDGTVRQRTRYQNGKRHGEHYLVLKSGKVKEHCIYEYGEISENMLDT